MKDHQKYMVLAGATFSTIAIVGLIWYLRKKSAGDDEDDEEGEELEFADLSASSVAASSLYTLEVTVPRYAVGAVIGKGGQNIRQLMKETGVRLEFDKSKEEEGTEQRNEDRKLLIKGERERVLSAETKVNDFIAAVPPIITLEVMVPSRACGRIIGKGGQNIRDICKTSGAKVEVDRDAPSSSDERKVTITGTKVQAEYAELMVTEVLEAFKVFEERKRQGQGVREEKKAEGKVAIAPVISEFPIVAIPDHVNYFQMFVSAFEKPDHLWIQPLTEDSPKLDELGEAMTAHFNSTSNEELEQGKIGDICCAPFPLDNEYYRACITGFDKEGSAELYYIDYGDAGTMPIRKIMQMRHEYLNLPAQAVECYLDNVTPAGDQWTEEAIADFEKLSHCAQWVPLMAKVVSYKEKENKKIPCIKIVDTSEDKDLDLADEMVRLGHASLLQGTLNKSDEINSNTSAGLESSGNQHPETTDLPSDNRGTEEVSEKDFVGVNEDKKEVDAINVLLRDVVLSSSPVKEETRRKVVDETVEASVVPVVEAAADGTVFSQNAFSSDDGRKLLSESGFISSTKLEANIDSGVEESQVCAVQANNVENEFLSEAINEKFTDIPQMPNLEGDQNKDAHEPRTPPLEVNFVKDDNEPCIPVVDTNSIDDVNKPLVSAFEASPVNDADVLKMSVSDENIVKDVKEPPKVAFEGSTVQNVDEPRISVLNQDFVRSADESFAPELDAASSVEEPQTAALKQSVDDGDTASMDTADVDTSSETMSMPVIDVYTDSNARTQLSSGSQNVHEHIQGPLETAFTSQEPPHSTEKSLVNEAQLSPSIEPMNKEPPVEEVATPPGLADKAASTAQDDASEVLMAPDANSVAQRLLQEPKLKAGDSIDSVDSEDGLVMEPSSPPNEKEAYDTSMGFVSSEGLLDDDDSEDETCEEISRAFKGAPYQSHNVSNRAYQDGESLVSNSKELASSGQTLSLSGNEKLKKEREISDSAGSSTNVGKVSMGNELNPQVDVALGSDVESKDERGDSMSSIASDASSGKGAAFDPFLTSMELARQNLLQLSTDAGSDDDDDDDETSSYFSARSHLTVTPSMDTDTDSLSYYSAREDATTPTNELFLRMSSADSDDYDIIKTPVASDDEGDTTLKYEDPITPQNLGPPLNRDLSKSAPQLKRNSRSSPERRTSSPTKSASKYVIQVVQEGGNKKSNVSKSAERLFGQETSV